MTTAPRLVRTTWLTIAVAIAIAWTRAEAAPPNDPGLVAASSGDQLWVVVPTPDQPPRFRLLHHAEGMNGPYFRVADEYAEAPEAIAAWKDAVWVVFPPGSAAGGRRSVIGFRARRNPALGTYYNDPPGHPELLDSLPGDSLLRGAAGSPDGPVVLFSVAARVSRESVRIVAPRPTLLAWHRDGWRELPLPDDAGDGGERFSDPSRATDRD